MAEDKLRIINVVGARPNFMKVAPIYQAMHAHPAFEPYIVHTGQHYDERMSSLFFDHLGMPKPDVYLGVGSGSHGMQTGKVMMQFEETLDELQPDMVLVVGDVNSTIACGLDAVKRGIKLVHVEAGLRSFDRTMPEEINRILTDQISDILYITERSAADNLQREGIPEDRIEFVGNVMIDSLLTHRAKASESGVLEELGVEPRGFGLVTLHRPANVDDPEMLAELLEVLCEIAGQAPLVFPMHPRTRARIEHFGLLDMLSATPALKLVEPMGYLDFLKCMDNARFVLTDSGGIQEETTVLGVPCITARENTERPVTVTQGTNVIAGLEPERLREEVGKILNGETRQGQCPELWDGKASLRIVENLLERWGRG